MKISKITIKQLFGIKEWQGDGKNIELVGDNGTGKTSVIDAIRYALTNSSDREFIVKNGETEGEIYIETDNGLSIDRKARTAMTDYKSVKQNGNVIPSPESFLKTIFTPLQLSPMEFISMDKKTQNATILDMIQYDWNLDTIKEWFGEIPRDVNYEQNILAVLNDIQAENGYYFMHRQDVNRDIRAKKAVIADIGSSLPIDYDGERWEKENLSDLYTEIEKIRKNNETIEKAKRLRDSHDGKIRSFQADKEIKIAALDTEMVQQEKNIESELAQLEERIKALREKKDGLAGVKADKVKVIQSEYEASVSKYEAEQASYAEYADMETTPIDDLMAKANETARHPQMGAKMKRDYQMIVCNAIRTQLPRLTITNPIIIHYNFYEPDKQRDKGNIFSFADKVFQDALQKCGVIKNDGWKEIDNFTHDFYVDKKNPRIEIFLEEIEKGPFDG